MSKKITLFSALSGFRTEIEHLDGKKIYINTMDVLKPGNNLIVKERGMTTSGNLYISLDIIFPETLIENRTELSKVLNQDEQI